MIMGKLWGLLTFLLLSLSCLSNANLIWTQAEKEPQNLQLPGSLSPQTSGPGFPQQTPPLSSQFLGSPSSQVSGSLSAQLPGLSYAQPSLPLSVQSSGPLSVQAAGSPSAQQFPGLFSAQPSGSLSAQPSGSLSAQPSGSLSAQLSGPLSAQSSGSIYAPPTGLFSGPLSAQLSGPLYPQPSGLLSAQQPRPLFPQPSGPLFLQSPGPVLSQVPGQLFPQISENIAPQLPGPLVPTSYGPKIPLANAAKCQLNDVDKVPCGEPSIDASHCGAINCCFDGQNCYYGKTVTVQCTIDGQFVLVVARDATLPRISLDSISLLGGSDGPCGVADYNANFAIYQFPVTACGTRVQGDYVVYENKMVSSYEVGVGPLGAITRDSHYELYFQCRYSTTSVESLAVALSSNDPPLPVVASGPLRVELRLGNGQCVTKGCVEEQVAYTSYYTEAEYPVTKVLRDPVYVEVRMLARTDPNLVLVLGRCWATSTPNPNSVPQWDLLVNGCPYKDDLYLSNLVPVVGSSRLQYPGHYKRFIFIHCSTAVCSPTAGATCEPRCNRRSKDVGSSVRHSRPVSVVSSGEVIYTDISSA
uniref:Zona pellucida sperm-binding protein 4 n=1 Tax=Astyanax mexicanus TaxID=7994 RepID=A0A8B9HS20_ASTMX